MFTRVWGSSKNCRERRGGYERFEMTPLRKRTEEAVRVKRGVGKAEWDGHGRSHSEQQ